MADRIDPALTSALRLSAPGALRVRPLAEAPRIARSDPASRADDVSRLDSFQFTSPTRPTRTTLPPSTPSNAANRMIAATVPGSVNFLADTRPTPTTTAALPMYRHPADRNAAATAVNAGRVLDVEG